MTKTLAGLLEDLDIEKVWGNPQVPIGGLAYDSRKVKKGDLFIAVSGTRLDGYRFIADAIQRGAHAVVAERAPEEGVTATFVQVTDSRKTLAQMALRFYEHPAQDLELIGVTGTNGKTTTTLLLESILKQNGHTVGVIGTLGYRWAHVVESAPMTTPESLDLQNLFYEMRQDHVSHVVMEVSSHALALGRVRDCAFRAGVFTNLSQDHLDFHKTMDDYFEAKTLLFRNYLSSGDKCSVAVVNGDDSYGRKLSKEIKKEVWNYSLSSPAKSNGAVNVWVKEADLTPSGIRAELSTPHGTLQLRSPLLGRLNLSNLLAAATTALALGIPKDAVCEGVAALDSVDGRLQRIHTALGFDVVVDFAHTPDAMEKSLTCLRELTRGRLWVVFGCGGDRDRGKRPLMGSIAAQLGDMVVLTSDNPRTESPEAIIGEIEPGVRSAGLLPVDSVRLDQTEKGYTIEPNRKLAIHLSLVNARPGDMVFIGGKGHETYQIIGSKKFSFDDRQVVVEFLNR